jgi:hypothetical protein
VDLFDRYGVSFVSVTQAFNTTSSMGKRAKRWVDQLMAGASLPEITTQEGRSPRHIRLLTSLAFMSLRLMSEIIDGHRSYTATDPAGRVPLVW